MLSTADVVCERASTTALNAFPSFSHALCDLRSSIFNPREDPARLPTSTRTLCSTEVKHAPMASESSDSFDGNRDDRRRLDASSKSQYSRDILDTVVLFMRPLAIGPNVLSSHRILVNFSSLRGLVENSNGKQQSPAAAAASRAIGQQ